MGESGPFVRPSEARQLWPAVPTGATVHVLALQHQLAESQYWSPQALDYHQGRQLTSLLHHAQQSTAWYRAYPAPNFLLDEKFDATAWANLPTLARDALQQNAGAALLSSALPHDHGQPRESTTTGSTARPVRVVGSDLNHFMTQAALVRDHLWQRRDLRVTLATVTSLTSDGEDEWWSPTLGTLFYNGPCVRKHSNAGIEAIVNWLRSSGAHTLLAYANLARAIAKYCLDESVVIPSLREVRTTGGVLAEDLRDLCERAWGARVIDTYSCAEVGVVALQCPEHPSNYHVQSEFVRVDVVNARNEPCQAGEIGRVLLTPLHNFAMPLIRYDIGDYAQVGSPCPCGRGLPTLTKILGRTRNMLRLPDGRTTWPTTPYSAFRDAPSVQQFQLVQDALDHIEFRLVATRPLTADEEVALTDTFHRLLDYPFRFTFRYVDEIARADLKYEDVISTVVH